MEAEGFKIIASSLGGKLGGRFNSIPGPASWRGGGSGKPESRMLLTNEQNCAVFADRINLL
jgi:hypothetical protein